MKYTNILLLSALACLLNTENATAQTPAFETREVATGLTIPWEIIFGPDSNIYFTQRNGYVCRVHAYDGSPVDTLIAETQTVSQGEGGMLGMALHPDFPSTPYIYVAYDYLDAGNYKGRVVRYTLTGGVLGSSFTLIENIPAAAIHNGCRLLINGGFLYLSTGDAAVAPNAQTLSSLSGKVLRINLDGTIPASNPIPGSPIWSWGHRNIQGLTTGPMNKIYASEHGPSTDDEFNNIEVGRNYGWPNVAGFCDQPSEMAFCADSNVAEPLFAWTPTLAVSGAEYYTGTMFPSLTNKFLLCTLKDASLYALSRNTAGDSITNASVLPGISFGRLRDICFSPDGRIYLSTSNTTSGSGPIDKIIELSIPGGLGISANQKFNFKIYPQPASNILNLLIDPSFGTAVYTIVGIDGKILISGQTNHGKVASAISISSLASGTYILLLRNEGGQVLSEKFMKQ